MADELASLSSALSASATCLKQIAGAQAKTAHNLNAEQAVAGKAQDVLFTIHNVASGPDTRSNVGNVTGHLEGTVRNYISKSGLPVQSMIKTHMALSSDNCFFPVKNSEDELLYTRVGSFSPNGDNLFVNQFGLVLQYVPVDGAGNLPDSVSSGSLQPLSVDNLTMSGMTTDSITVGSGLSGEIGNTVSKTFNVVDASGTARTVRFNFQRVNLPAGSTNAQAWRLTVNGPSGSTVQGDATSPYGNAAYGVVVEFDSSGKPAAFKQGDGAGGYSNLTSLPSLNIEWPGGVADSSINLSLGTLGRTDGVMTISGGYSFMKVVSNGYESGVFENLEFSKDGKIFGSFSNNQIKLLGRIALATVNNADGMLPVANGCYLPTSAAGNADNYSGSVSFGYAGTNAKAGQIAVGALESSNVEIINEMSKLVQRELQFSVATTSLNTDKNMFDTLIKNTR